ncbi:MAG: tetratricopeptide repeat protein [Polyangia bacterium]
MAEVAPSGGDATAKTEARAHFDRGVQLGHAGDYRQAAAEFQRAYQISPHYAVLYNLAQAQIALGQTAEAIDSLQRYLAEGGANVPADRRTEVQGTIKQLSAGHEKHQVTASPEGDRARPQAVAVDEKPQAASPDERRAPGPVAAPAQPASGPLLLQQSPGPDADATSHEHVRRTIGFVTGGVGVAMGAVALGCYLWNRSRFDAYESAMVNDSGKADSIRTVSAVTTGLAIGSGVLIATGVVLVLTARPRDTTSPQAGLVAGSAVAIGPQSISWRATW